jgi:hypothetical protein
MVGRKTENSIIKNKIILYLYFFFNNRVAISNLFYHGIYPEPSEYGKKKKRQRLGFIICSAAIPKITFDNFAGNH